MEEIVTVALGIRDSHDDWVINGREDVQCFDTGIPEIVITPSLNGDNGYNLTHVESGFFMLGPFPTMVKAREAAIRLYGSFPHALWSKLFAPGIRWTKASSRAMFRAMNPEDKEWMLCNGVRRSQ